MKVYSLPEGIEPPAFEDSLVDDKYSYEKDNEVTKQFIDQLKNWLIANDYSSDLTGEIVRFPVADGYAQYMVAKKDRTTFLIHLPIHDAWHIPDAHARGLRVQDIREMVKASKNLDKLFGRS